jgi:DNA-binding NarL/FixJ family response regulator
LVGEHKGFRQEVQRLLELDFEVIGAAPDGRAALEMVELLSPDVAVFDVYTSVLRGIEAARRLRERCTGVRVVFLSSHQSPVLIREALASGALGYVFKASAIEDLGPAIWAALDERSFVSSLK